MNNYFQFSHEYTLAAPLREIFLIPLVPQLPIPN